MRLQVGWIQTKAALNPRREQLGFMGKHKQTRRNLKVKWEGVGQIEKSG